MNISSLLHSRKKKSQDKGNIMLLYEFVAHLNFVAVLPLLQKEHMGTWKGTEEANQAGESHTTAFTEETPHPLPAGEMLFLTMHQHKKLCMSKANVGPKPV